MKDWKPVFLLARKNLVFFAVVLIVGVAVIFGARHFANTLNLEVMQTQAALQDNQSQLESKKADLENMESHIKRYKILKAQGLIGEPARTLWVEQLQQTRKNLRLPDTLGVELNESKPLATNGVEVVDDGATMQPLMHDLSFEIRDVHEQEVLALMQDYRIQAKGRFRINDCQLFEPKDTGLSARCVMRFITMPDADVATTNATGQLQ